MKLLGYVFLFFIVILFGSIALTELKKDVQFRDACYEKGGMFKMQGSDRKCLEVKEIQLWLSE